MKELSRIEMASLATAAFWKPTGRLTKAAAEAFIGHVVGEKASLEHASLLADAIGMAERDEFTADELGRGMALLQAWHQNVWLAGGVD